LSGVHPRQTRGRRCQTAVRMGAVYPHCLPSVAAVLASRVALAGANYSCPQCTTRRRMDAVLRAGFAANSTEMRMGAAKVAPNFQLDAGPNEVHFDLGSTSRVTRAGNSADRPLRACAPARLHATSGTRGRTQASSRSARCRCPAPPPDVPRPRIPCPHTPHDRTLQVQTARRRRRHNHTRTAPPATLGSVAFGE
jgi:hypothetical protein